jgi:hypothetical protein
MRPEILVTPKKAAKHHMSNFKKVFVLVPILFLAVIHVIVYWNQHLFYEAGKIGDTEQRIAVLEKAGKFYPLNDLVFYELGKAYHELGINSLGEQGRSRIHLQMSIDQLIRSLRINSPSYFGHFYLARSLQNMSFDSSSYEEKANQEFKKAARLAGENTEVYYEVGKVFLSQWQTLSKEDRELTIGMLKKVTEGKDRERIQSLFYIWQINVEDFDVMDEIFPEDAQIYRDFAEFLGERSHSLEERQRYLAQAEFLDFRRAQDVFESGERAFFYYRFKEAQALFKTCRNILENIRFYQDLHVSQHRIDPSEFGELQKLSLLNLAKSGLEQGEEIRNVATYLWEYLEKEDSAASIKELESYLIKRGLQIEKTDTVNDDFDRLALMLYLSLKQGRFRDNMSVGQELLRRIAAAPKGQEDRFVKILEIVGESYQRVDFIYDSNDFYNKALQWNPDNLEILVKLRRNHERLNAIERIREIDRRINEIVSPQVMEVHRTIQRGERSRHRIILEGSTIKLSIHLGLSEGARVPLVTVLFNGRVVWEDYSEGGAISVPAVESKVGENMIQVTPLNRKIELVKIAYSVL